MSSFIVIPKKIFAISFAFLILVLPNKINKTDDISAFEIADLSSVFSQAAVSELCHNSKNRRRLVRAKHIKLKKCFAQG